MATTGSSSVATFADLGEVRLVSQVVREPCRLTPAAQAVSVAWQALGAVADALGLQRPPDTADRMRQARTIIERECVNGLTVASLVAALQMDRTTLFRQFKEAFGVSPKSYLDDQRLRSALALLRHTDSSIKETAYACGWPSARDFCRAFRLRFQQTPSQWRADCRAAGSSAWASCRQGFEPVTVPNGDVGLLDFDEDSLAGR